MSGSENFVIVKVPPACVDSLPQESKWFANKQSSGKWPLLARHLTVVGYVIFTSILIVCAAQCAILRLEVAEVRHEMDRLKAETGHATPGVGLEGYDLRSRPGDDDTRRRRDTSGAAANRQQNSQNSAKHFMLDKNHLDAAISRAKNGGDDVNYSGGDLRWREALHGSSGRRHREGESGSVVVTTSGFYLVYGQLTYFNSAAKSAFAVKLNDQTILRCLQSVDIISENASSSSSTSDVDQPPESIARLLPTLSELNAKVKTCYTAGLFYVPEDGRLSIVNHNRAVLNDSHANFWGFVKLYDA